MHLKAPLGLSLIAAVFLFVAGCQKSPESDWTMLLDGDLSQWEIWMGVPHTSVTGLPEGTPQSNDYRTGTPLGLGNDPKGVFSMIEEDGEDVLKISGEIYGGLTSLAEFENFHFSAQVKFGDKKWAPRLNAPRDNGFLYYCYGDHGSFWNVWMSSVECQVQETDIGDLYLLAGPAADVRTSMSVDANRNNKPKPRWDPKGELASFGSVMRSENFENPHGEWSTVEVYAIGQRAIHVVNGRIVLAMENIRKQDGAPLSDGKFQIQSEGAETYYRDMKVRSISEFPADLAAASRF